MDFEEKQDSRFTRLRLETLIVLMFQSVFSFFYESFSSQRRMVKKRPANALLKASDAKILLGRLLLFHAFCILFMNCFHLSFVIRCSVLVAISLLVSQERLFVMQASDCAFQGIFRRIRHSLFPASSTLYFHLEYVIWNFIAWELFQKLLYSSLVVGLMTSRAHSNGCNTGDLWLGRLVAFHDLLPSVASTSCPLSRSSCTVAGTALRGCFMRSMNDLFGPVFCNYFCIFFCFFFVQNYNLRVGFRRLSPPFKVRNLENMCIRWMYLSNIPREVLWLLIWMRDICLIAFFFRSHISPKLQLFLRPIGARSKDRLLWTLKRSRDNPSPSFFFSAYEFFNFFVVVRSFCGCICFFFRLFGLQSSTVYSEACKMQNLLHTGLSSSTASIFYTWLVFSCYFWCEFLLLATFFKVVSRKDY